MQIKADLSKLDDAEWAEDRLASKAYSQTIDVALAGLPGPQEVQ